MFFLSLRSEVKRYEVAYTLPFRYVAVILLFPNTTVLLPPHIALYPITISLLFPFAPAFVSDHRYTEVFDIALAVTPSVINLPAQNPFAVLLCPVVLLDKELVPSAALPYPVVFANKEP